MIMTKKAETANVAQNKNVVKNKEKAQKNSKIANSNELKEAQEDQEESEDEDENADEEKLMKKIVDFIGLEIKITKNKFTSADLKEIIEDVKNTKQHRSILFCAFLTYLTQLSERYGHKVPQKVIDKLIASGCTPEFQSTMIMVMIQRYMEAAVREEVLANFNDIVAIANATKDANGEPLVKGKKYICQVTPIPATETGKIKQIKKLIQEKKYAEIDKLVASESLTMPIDDVYARIDKLMAKIYTSVANLKVNEYTTCYSSVGSIKQLNVIKVLNATTFTHGNIFTETELVEKAKVELKVGQEMQNLMMNTITSLFGTTPEQLVAGG